MALIPSSPIYAAKLKELGYSRHIFPLDNALGISHLPFKISVAAMLEIAKVCTRSESFEDAEQILKEKTLIHINDDTMRKVTTTIGTLVYNNEVKIANNFFEKFNKANLYQPKYNLNNTLYLEVDGAMLPTRNEDNKGSVYKENKLGMAFSSDYIRWWTDKHGSRQHQILKRDYTSLIGDSDEFTKLMLSLAIRNGYGDYKNTVLISDGATWIRNMKDYIFYDAQQILDYYHLKEHIIDFAKLIFNYNEDKYLPWANEVCTLFKESKTNTALNRIKKSANKVYKNELDQLLKYLSNNEKNIDYATYLKKGFFIGSGAIESSNKTIVHRRLKFGAMRWKIESGQAIVTLVAKLRSGKWESDVVRYVYSHYGEPYKRLVSLLDIEKERDSESPKN